MARTTDRATIRSSIRIQADRPSTVRPTDAQLNGLIDSAWTHLWDIMTSAEPFRFVEQADISITSGTRSFDLPSDFKSCMGVAVSDTSKTDGYSSLERYNWKERYNYNNSQDKLYAKYNIQNGKLWLFPTPNWSDTVRIEYIPYAEEWSDSTTIDTVNGWDEWIVYQVCADLHGLDKEDPAYFIMMRQNVENRILSTIDYDVGEVETVSDWRRHK